MLEAALAQMRERGYADKYRDRQEPVHLIAVVCNRDARNLLDIRAEPAGREDTGRAGLEPRG